MSWRIGRGKDWGDARERLSGTGSKGAIFEKLTLQNMPREGAKIPRVIKSTGDGFN